MATNANLMSSQEKQRSNNKSDANPSPVVACKWSYDDGNTKQDMMEMMMIQNAQMHQIMMQRLMMASIPKKSEKRLGDNEKPTSTNEEDSQPSTIHYHHYLSNQSSQDDFSAMYQHQVVTKHQEQLMPPYWTKFSLLPTYNLQNYNQNSPFHDGNSRKRKDSKETQTVRINRKPINSFWQRRKPYVLRKFRKAAFAAFFIATMKMKILRQKRNPDTVESERFHNAIRIRECIATLHNSYLQPSGKILEIFKRMLTDAQTDLSVVLSSTGSKEKDIALQELAYMVENITFQITEIMPTSGILGTTRTSFAYELIRPRKSFPNGYFWQIEKNLLRFDASGRILEIDRKEAIIILRALFFGRALVSTLFLKPLETALPATFNLQLLTYRMEKNLAIMASIFVYILRKIYSKNIAPQPFEISSHLYSDEEMAPVIKKLKTSIDYAETLIMNWGEEYVKRLTVI